MNKSNTKAIQNRLNLSLLITLAAAIALLLIPAAGCESPEQRLEDDEVAAAGEEETFSLKEDEEPAEPSEPGVPEAPTGENGSTNAEAPQEGEVEQPQEEPDQDRDNLNDFASAGEPDIELPELPDLKLEEAVDPDFAVEETPAGGAPEEPALPESPESPETPEQEEEETTLAGEHTPRVAATLEPPLLAITFDDGNVTDFTTALPLMQERGIPGTTYITTSLVGEEGYLTWDQIHLLEETGWTIGCHSHTHPHLSELSKEEIREEMEEVDRSFTNKGFDPPKHHAYPYGDYNAEVVEVVKQYRNSARAIPGAVPPQEEGSDLYRLEAVQAYLTCEESLYETALQVREAALEETNLILYTHDIKEEPSDYGAHPRYFAELLDYINELNIETVTMDELYDYLTN